nr:ATP-binding protein [Rhodococcus sp. (in: high G+C Gram-positive bacteria)]
MRNGRAVASTARAAVPNSAGQRIKILIARFLGLGFVAYLFISASGFAEGARILAPWWTPLAVVLVFGPGIALFIVSFAAPDRIPIAAAAAAIGIPAASALWFPAWTGDYLDGAARGTWMSALAGLAGVCAALVWRPMVAILVQFVSTSTAAAVDQFGLFGPDASLRHIAYAAVWAFGFTALLAAAVVAAVRTGAILDATKDNLDCAVADAAAAKAREHERVRFDALIHDRVLTTLLATARPGADGRLADEARSALVELDRVADHPDRTESTTAARFADRLSATLAEVDVDGTVVVSISVDDNATLFPTPVTSAIVGAAAEALRNSIRHAGSRAERSVAVELRPDAVHVIVTDTGDGFDAAAVGPGHFGIEVSIVRRMAELDGGRSVIESSRERGTSVALDWSAQH